jgi:hypothetical protein
MPPNRLGEMRLPPDEKPASWLLTNDTNQVTFEALHIDTSGAVSADFQVRIRSYDFRLSETKPILSDEFRNHLKELGFSPFDGYSVRDFEPALYMVWNRHLQGRQHPALSKDSYSGQVLYESCCSSGDDILIEADSVKLERNRRINSMLAPLSAIRDAVQFLLALPLLLFILLSGFRPGA